MGIELGLTYESVRFAYRRAVGKMQIPQNVDKRDDAGKRTEYTDPEKAAEMIDVVTNPLLDNLAEACRESGLPDQLTNALMKRMQMYYQPVDRELKRVKTDVLVREFENLGLRAIQSITDGDLEALDAYKRTLVGAIAIDKRELLDGRPTERISVEDRRALPELMGELLREAERRGLIREVNPETGKVHLVDHEDAPVEVRAGRARMEVIDVETL
jgi:hypothetical protein